MTADTHLGIGINRSRSSAGRGEADLGAVAGCGGVVGASRRSTLAGCRDFDLGTCVRLGSGGGGLAGAFAAASTSGGGDAATFTDGRAARAAAPGSASGFGATDPGRLRSLGCWSPRRVPRIAIVDP